MPLEKGGIWLHLAVVDGGTHLERAQFFLSWVIMYLNDFFKEPSSNNTNILDSFQSMMLAVMCLQHWGRYFPSLANKTKGQSNSRWNNDISTPRL